MSLPPLPDLAGPKLNPLAPRPGASALQLPPPLPLLTPMEPAGKAPLSAQGHNPDGLAADVLAQPLEPQACLVCDEPIIQVGPMQVHPNCVIDPQVFAADLIAKVRGRVVGQKRNHQVMIGPSEIGHPCDRRIGYKIGGVPAVNDRGVAWKAFIGSCVHTEMQQMMAEHEIARWSADGILLSGRVQARWHVEERVNVGDYGGGDVEGNTDVFDAATGIVYDWKFPGINQINRNYKTKGPGRQYTVQGHTYGQGWANKGFEVTHVTIIMFSRDGEFTDRYVWTQPWDPRVAQEGLARIAGLYSLIQLLGPSVAIPSFPTTEAYCQHCPWFSDGHTNLATACPGDASREAKTTQPFRGLV